MSTGRLPAADDVLPVLIYVVIMVSKMNEKAMNPQLIPSHFPTAGKSSVSALHRGVHQLLPEQETGRRRRVLLDAFRIRCQVHQDNGLSGLMLLQSALGASSCYLNHNCLALSTASSLA